MDRTANQTRWQGDRTGWQQDVLFTMCLAVLCFLLFFAFLGDRPLWDIDEGMHAATSKDMILDRDWITPQVNGKNFYDKPPLFNWLVALSLQAFGFTEFAARLPAALLGLGCVLLTYGLGRKMFSPALGLLGGAILATSIEFIILSQVVVHDIALAFFVTLALLLFYFGYHNESHRKGLFICSYASAGFAVLAKGPIGFLLPALIIGLFLLFRRNLLFIKKMQIGWGIPVLLLIAAPWYVLIALENQEYAGYFFIRQNIQNFLSSEQARHLEPFYYYLPVFLGGFFPWSFFFPIALYRGLKTDINKDGDGPLFLLIWFGVFFFFFSAASSKLSTYILPLFPAAALLVAAPWHALIKQSSKGLTRGFLWSTTMLVILIVCGMGYVLLYPPIRLETAYGIDMARIHTMGFLMTGWGVLLLLSFLKKSYRLSFASLVGLVVTTLLFFTVFVVPSIDPYRSTKALGRELDRRLPPGENMVFYRELKDSTLFYTNRKATVIKHHEALQDYLKSKDRIFCVIEEKRLKKARKRLGGIEDMYVLSRQGDKLLISNRRSP